MMVSTNDFNRTEPQGLTLTVSEYFASFLAERGVRSVYEVSGGMITFLTDAIYRRGFTQIINTRHEQAAGFAAEGATRISGTPRIAMGTSGPGATNLITAIGSSYFDSIPVIFVTGQVHTNELRRRRSQRQNGFQELDIVSAVSGITKFAKQVNSAEDFPQLLQESWRIATDRRPGPILLDIPIDIQQKLIVGTDPQPPIDKPKEMTLNDEKSILNSLGKAKRPLILAGGGIRASGAYEGFLEFIEELKIPVVYSLMGKDLLPSNHELNLGFIGSYGNRWANQALSKSDVLLVLGSRLDVRQTGSDIADFKKNKEIIRIDIDADELQGRVKANISIECGLKCIQRINTAFQRDTNSIREFITIINHSKMSHPPESEQELKLELSPHEVMKAIGELTIKANGYLVDVGQHQMWAAQSLEIRSGQRFITSGGMGAMGFALPASIGAAIEHQGRWAVIVGDGCLQLCLGELQTIKHYNLPIDIFVINNNQHGMVAQFQDENMNSRYVSTRIGYSAPSFRNVAEAFSIKTIEIKNRVDLITAKEFMADSNSGPRLIEVKMDNRAKALPKMDRFAKLSDF